MTWKELKPPRYERGSWGWYALQIVLIAALAAVVLALATYDARHWVAS